MNLVLRGVHVLDPELGSDEHSQDVWIRDGVLQAIGPALIVDGAVEVDLERERGEQCLLMPTLIDLHAHLREPGDSESETVASGAAAAAAGGFGTVLAMANTTPPIDDAEAVVAALQRAAGCGVAVLQTAAVSKGLRGRQLVDIAACASAGAVAFSDDGRNAITGDVLCQALMAAAECDRPVLVHPEDEGMIAGHAGNTDGAVVRCSDRPVAVEESAVATALAALRRAGRGRLHLQHVSTAAAVRLLRAAREEGLHVTAEATPHHLTMTDRERTPLHRVNPPLRDEEDVTAVREAVRDGIIDAIATDHAPHSAHTKGTSFEDAAPGMVGLETALSLCMSLTPSVLPVMTLVERLTSGPRHVLGDAAARPALRKGMVASCTLFDPVRRWRVEPATLRSASCNTPLLGTTMQGQVLLTIVNGGIAHADPSLALQEAAHA